MTENTLVDIIETYNRQKNQLTEQIKLRLPELYKEFFEKYPYLHALRITATTPSFNDGEPCYHRIHADYGCVVVSFRDEEEEFLDLWDIKNRVDASDDSEVTTAMANFINNFGDCGYKDVKAENTLFSLLKNLKSLEDLLEDCYGTNVAITVTSTGSTQVEDYYTDY